MGTHTDIRWQPWGEAAFAESQKTQKPILLDLSAVWCHWCHVMDETSYSDDEVIELINDHFVPIRVDIDRRPDIRERYNFGGYPTTAFLDADGEVIAGGTYIPPDQLKRTLMQVKSYYETSGGKAQTKRQPREVIEEAATGPLSLDIVEEVLGALLQQYDELYGGFGGAPKFPQSDAVDFALYQHKVTGNRYFRQLAEKTLGAMAGGGMYDSVEGGFFRYSVTRDWSEPHYEKMLEVNIGLLRNYLNAYALLGEPRYREIAEDVFRYVEAVLRAPEGGFYGSQDADEEYYKAGAKGRAKLDTPYVDETLYTDLNGQAVSVYLRASVVLEEPAYEEAALATLQVLEDRVWTEDGALHHFWDGEPKVLGLLSDYVYLARAYLEAYETRGEEAHLARARTLVDSLLDALRDEDGLLIDRRSEEGDIGLLKVPQKPLVDNAQAALVLLKLAELTREERYRETAQTILEGFGDRYTRYSAFAAPYALAVVALLKGVLKLDVVGGRKEPETEELHRLLLSGLEPRRTLRLLRPGTPAFKEAGYPSNPAPAVYACVGTLCSNPILGESAVEEVQAFLAEVDEGAGATVPVPES